MSHSDRDMPSTETLLKGKHVHFVRTGKDIVEDDPEGLRTWLGGWRPDAFDLQTAKAEFDR